MPRYEKDVEYQQLLKAVHIERYKAHWGKNFDVSSLPWPHTPEQWRQTSHGAPWDTNVLMAEFQLKLIEECIKDPSIRLWVISLIEM